MNIEKLKEELKNEGYQSPNVRLVTPEIRTCDIVANSPSLKDSLQDKK